MSSGARAGQVDSVWMVRCGIVGLTLCLALIAAQPKEAANQATARPAPGARASAAPGRRAEPRIALHAADRPPARSPLGKGATAAATRATERRLSQRLDTPLGQRNLLGRT